MTKRLPVGLMVSGGCISRLVPVTVTSSNRISLFTTMTIPGFSTACLSLMPADMDSSTHLNFFFSFQDHTSRHRRGTKSLRTKTNQGRKCPPLCSLLYTKNKMSSLTSNNNTWKQRGADLKYTEEFSLAPAVPVSNLQSTLDKRGVPHYTTYRDTAHII